MTDYRKEMARYIRDLLEHDEQLIKFDHIDQTQVDPQTNYIVINDSGINTTLSNSSSYDPELEIMTRNQSRNASIKLEFYGTDAQANVERFCVLNNSEKARQLKLKRDITVYTPSTALNLKSLLGNQYGNRWHLDILIEYTISAELEVLRVDTPNEQITED